MGAIQALLLFLIIGTSSIEIWQLIEGQGPFIAAAIHDGHLLRNEIASLTNLSDSERLREEDPHTGYWTSIVSTRVIGLKSRFEVDLNRPPEKAVYLKPEDAWGLSLWKKELSVSQTEISMAGYHAFYKAMKELFDRKVERYGRFFVFDLHTYNHRREGPNGPYADPELNPDVNIGTGTMDRQYWKEVVDRFIEDLRDFDFDGKKLDVRENVKFRGGQFSRWIHQQFPKTGCSIAVEFKKFFMDEWTGKADERQVNLIYRALQSTIPGLLEAFEN